MFFHIRNELQESIENAEWIKQDGRHFLSDMVILLLRGFK